MAITKLQLYNIAMFACKEGALDSLTEDREGRYLLDEVWVRGKGAEEYFLEQGLWNHAIRTQKIDASSSVTTSFGYQKAFDIPSDFVRLVQLSGDEYFNDALNTYEMESGYIYADFEPIYMRFVSNDANFGLDLSRWPPSFYTWGGHWLATQIAPSLLNDSDQTILGKKEQKLLIDARSKDAQQEPVRYAPASGWQRARHGRGRRLERGLTGRLIG